MTKNGFYLLIALLTLVAVGCGSAAQQNPTAAPTAANPWKTERFSAAANGAQSIELTLELGPARTTLHAMSEADSEAAIDAQVEYMGEIQFLVEDGPPKTITLREDRGDAAYPAGETLTWDIALNPNVVYRFNLTAGDGFLNADLTGLQLAQSILETGAGGGEITLPNTGAVYQLALGAGAGSLVVNIAEGSQAQIPFLTMSSGDVTLNLTAGSDFRARVNMAEGDLILDLPEDPNFYLDVQVPGQGEVQIDDRFDFAQIRGRSAKSGTWQSSDYDVRQPQIALIIGVMREGNVIIR